MKLNFFKPRLTPHGSLGVVSLTGSGCLTLGAISGYEMSPESLQISSALIAMNALSSLPLLSGDKTRKNIFLQSILLQCALSYMSIRVFYNNEFLQNVDWLCFYILFYALTQLWQMAETQKYFESVIKCGVLCASSFALYPLQFALFGNAWWSHVQEIYPTQALGFSEFVFVPSQFIIAALMFAATLLDRKIISIKQAQGLFIFPVLILIGTVTAQEMYMPLTSTQELFIGLSYSNPVIIYKTIVDFFTTTK